MPVDEKYYEADDPRKQLPDVTLDVEDVQVTAFSSRLRLGGSENIVARRNRGLQDATKYQDSSCYEDIKLFKEDLVLTDTPFTIDNFDYNFNQIKMEDVRTVLKFSSFLF